MSGRHRQRGAVALATALVVLLAASLLAAAVADIARSELVVADGRRTLARGLVAADACLARVVAALPAAWDQSRAIAGADGVGGTADDGILTAPSGCTAVLVAGPLGPARPLLDVAVTVRGGGRQLRAIVGAARAPVPAVVWTTDGAALGTVTGRLQIDGVDVAQPALPSLPAFAIPGDPAVPDAWIASEPGVVVVGATGAPEYAPAPPLGDLATRLVAWGAQPAFTPVTPAPAVTLHVVLGDLVIATPGFGTGLLDVDGHLDILADFAFSGIVAARGGVRVATGVNVRITGGLWLGPPGFDVGGDLLVRHDRAALDAVAARFPLPRRAVVAGLEDR